MAEKRWGEEFGKNLPRKVCRMCVHPAREEIEKRWALGARLTPEFCAEYGMDRWNMLRHFKRHFEPRMKLAVQARDAASILGKVEKLVGRAERTLDAIEASEDPARVKQMAGMYREVRQGLELMARMTGEYQTANVQALLAKCGGRTEAELIAMCEEKEQLGHLQLPDYFEDALAMLVFCVEQRPEWWSRVLESAPRRLEGPAVEKSSAEVVDESVAVEQAGA